MSTETKKRTSVLQKIAFIAVVCAVAALPLLFSGCTNEAEKDGGQSVEVQAPVEEEKPIELNILCVGDIMVHRSQIASHYNEEIGAYDYSNNFKHIKKYVEAADLALCNLETTFAGQPYTGYPTFSAPDELADALKDTGFDVAITCNNHMMDKGGNGLRRTLEVLTNKGFLTVGSRLEVEAPRYVMTEVNGVNVAVVAYTYETATGGNGTALNGVSISAENAALINSFSYETLDADLAKVKADCDSAREAGADIVILYYHWGEEYHLTANKWQRQIAQYSVDNMDIDMIFGSHPHVLQEMEYIQKTDSEKKVPVFYSMGNLISNQRRETLGDTMNSKHTETGIMANVTLSYMKSEGKILDISMSAIPTWVDKYGSSSKPIYEIIPLDESLTTNETLQVSGHLSRAQQALEDSHGVLKAN